MHFHWSFLSHKYHWLYRNFVDQMCLFPFDMKLVNLVSLFKAKQAASQLMQCQILFDLEISAMFCSLLFGLIHFKNEILSSDFPSSRPTMDNRHLYCGFSFV